ncbi:hypothetical protein SEA_PICARD_2 [Streptomyces phage Picard]|uniref:Uncharacterized protein n=2 Tax=Picardvirus picard TaxID=2734264 RepID=A0A1J0MCF1_9CAUD|nr:hypothetical protein HOR45_gp02 [Streptomyces phage Picard]APD18534.1 hypothetical protein SEA_PICARD_2 [Streptomyces phage Picard]APD18644.1 hypothetical protein SEA_MOJORITA_2 [Streptomyces phage Mojorita]
MTSLPTHITTDQRRTALRALGLPPALVQSVTVDQGDGVTASLYVLDREGRRIRHGDEVLTADVRIPAAEEVNTS